MNFEKGDSTLEDESKPTPEEEQERQERLKNSIDNHGKTPEELQEIRDSIQREQLIQAGHKPLIDAEERKQQEAAETEAETE